VAALRDHAAGNGARCRAPLSGHSFEA